MKKNQERRLHRKNAKLVKEGGTPMQINRVVKADTTVRERLALPWPRADRLCAPPQRRCGHCGQVGHMSTSDTHHKNLSMLMDFIKQRPTVNVLSGRNTTALLHQV